MTSVSPPAPEQGTGSRLLHFLGTLLVFVFLGPLIGGFITIAGLAFLAMDTGSFGDALMVMLAMIIYGLWMAYFIGIVPAAIVGAVVGGMDAFRGGTPFSFVVALGFAAGVGWSMMLDNGDGEDVLWFRALIVVASLVATVVCWKATRWRGRI